MKEENQGIVLAIIPARGGSKGIPRKNIIDLGGKPLVAHTIEHASKARNIDDFIVNSDDAEIREIASSFGAKTMDRPDEYAHDQILQEVDLLLKWSVEQYEKKYATKVDIVVLLYPTAPLRDVPSVEKAVDMVKEGSYDSVLSLYHDTRYLWKKNGDETVSAQNYDPNNRMPRQKEVWNQWAENKAIYVMKKELLFNVGRIAQRCGYVEMEKWRSIDIDEFVDLEMARALYRVKCADEKNTHTD